MTPGTKVDIETESGTVLRCEGILSDPSEFNTVTRGGRVSLEVLESTEQLIVVDSATIPTGETQTATVVKVRDGGTLNINGTLETGRVSVADGGTLNITGTLTITGESGGMDLLRYQPFAGSFGTVETLSSAVAFRERLPSTGAGDDPTSLLVSVRPGDDLLRDDVRGVWGLVDNVTDTRDPSIGQERAAVELTVLARYSEYDDHQAVRDDLEATL